MVRILVGTMVEMHGNRSDPDSIRGIIEAHDRDSSGATAPPWGLYLLGVTYDPPLSSMESAF